MVAHRRPMRVYAHNLDELLVDLEQRGECPVCAAMLEGASVCPTCKSTLEQLHPDMLAVCRCGFPAAAHEEDCGLRCPDDRDHAVTNLREHVR